jgi:hypothetical protein
LFSSIQVSINYTTAEMDYKNNAIRALFLDKNEDLIETENGISKLENGVLSNLILLKY